MIQALAQLAEKGDQHAITAVAARLEDGLWPVRHAAVQALAQLAEKGDQYAITAVAALLESREVWQVRRAAVDALAQLADLLVGVIKHVLALIVQLLLQ